MSYPGPAEQPPSGAPAGTADVGPYPDGAGLPPHPGSPYPPGRPYGAAPYGAPPYGDPQYGALPYGAQPWGGPLPPEKHIGWAVAALVLFWPLCIPAFIASSKVSDLWFMGRYQESLQASADAKRWGKLGVIIGASLNGAVILFYLVIVVVMVGVGVSTSS